METELEHEEPIYDRAAVNDLVYIDADAYPELAKRYPDHWHVTSVAENGDASAFQGNRATIFQSGKYKVAFTT